MANDPEDRLDRSTFVELAIGLAVMLVFDTLAVVAVPLTRTSSSTSAINGAFLSLLAVMVGGFIATRMQSRHPMVRGTIIVLGGTIAYQGMLVAFKDVINLSASIEWGVIYFLLGFAGVGIARGVFAGRWDSPPRTHGGRSASP